MKVDVDAVQNGGGREYLRLQMPQQVTGGATEFQNGPDIRRWIHSTRAQKITDVLEEHVAGEVDVIRPESLLNFVSVGVGYMIRPEEAVQCRGIAAADIVEHTHRKFES
jgi:hypothetical protein